MVLTNSAIRRNAGLALLFVCSLIICLHSADSLRYSDERDYDQLARSLLHSHAFSFTDGTPTAYRPPGYPLLIAAAYAITERPLTAKIENVLFLLLAALALGTIATRIDANAGSIAPFAALAYPLLIYASSLLYPQVLGCLLLTTTVMLVTEDQLSVRRAALAGLVYGILVLAIPYFIFMLPIVCAFVLFRPNWRNLAGLRNSVVLAGAAALLIAPWTLRNYLDFHALIPVSSNGGWNLFIGNSPDTTPNGSVLSVDVISLCKRVQPRMSDNQVDAALGKCATDWIRENPSAALKLYLRKVMNYFNFRNELATQNAAPAWTDWLLFFTYYPLLAIAIARAALFRQFPLRGSEALIYILYVANALISAIFFTRIRFRIPFDFLLLAIAAGFVGTCWSARRRMPNMFVKQSEYSKVS